MKRQRQTDIWIIISFGTSSQKSSTILKWNKPNMKCFLFSLKMTQTQLHKSLDQLINLLISFVQNSKATKLQRNVEIPLLRCWMYTLEHLWLSQTGLSPTRSNNKHNKHRVTKCCHVSRYYCIHRKSIRTFPSLGAALRLIFCLFEFLSSCCVIPKKWTAGVQMSRVCKCHATARGKS